VFRFGKHFQRIILANIKVKEFRNAVRYDPRLLAIEIVDANRRAFGGFVYEAI